jgi:hypothetical protein
VPPDLPAPTELWRAIDAYLAVAYEGAPPSPVAERLVKVRGMPASQLYDCDAFERADDRYALRLGNRFYAHMKLVVEAAPSGRPLFRTDTHDRHVLDLVGAGDAGLQELVARNEAIARAIEDSWTALGLPTTRDYWRQEMARRRGPRPS